MESLSGGVCGVENCRSSSFLLGDDGFYYCGRGHRQEGAVAIGQDDTAFGQSGRTTRKQREESEKTFRQLHGREGFEHYLLSYQLILRKQLWFLTKEKKMNPDLEKVVRTLWGLRIKDFAHRLKNDDVGDSQPTVFSSQPDRTETQTPTGRGKIQADSPRLIDTLALIFLGAVHLRISISIGDIHKMAAQGEIIYYFARKSLPKSMTERLAPQYHNMLEPSVILQPGVLHRATLDLALKYERNHRVTFPALNYPPLLYRRIFELSLTPEVYLKAKKIAKALQYDFKFPSSSSEKKVRLVDYPEIQLVSALVTATKITHPFGDIVRHPESAQDDAVAVIDWSVWETAKEQYEAEFNDDETLNFEDVLKLDNKTVFEMDDKKLDQYMEWYAKHLIDEDVKANAKDGEFRQALYDMFPLERGKPSDTQDNRKDKEKDMDFVKAARERRLRKVVEGLRVQEIITPDEEAKQGRVVQRLGDNYSRYRTVDELPRVARKFYEEVADLTELKLETLVNAVFQTERKIEVIASQLSESE